MESENNDLRFDNAIKVMQNTSEIEKKIRIALDFMREALSDETKARFRDFWRMKKECLDLFKLEIPHSSRGLFWGEYTTLLNEAHELQKIVEENTVFEVEQLMLAITDLEESLKPYLQKKETLSSSIEKLREENLFLHTAKERLISLKKEILGIEMRVSLKSKLLDRLSFLGNFIFPRKKEVLKEMSQLFSDEVESFCALHFDFERKKITSREPLFRLRESIKNHQARLKTIEMTNDKYKKARGFLSQSWDIIDKQQKMDAEKRTKESEEESSNLQKYTSLMNEISFNNDFKENLEKVFRNVKALKLSHTLFTKISDYKRELEKKYEEKVFAEIAKQQELIERKRQQKEEAFKKVLGELKAFEKNLDTISLVDAEKEYERLMKEAELEKPSRKLYFYFYDLALKIKCTLAKKRGLVKERKQEFFSLKSNLKKWLEMCRRELAECGLDVEFAFTLKEMIRLNKEVLETLETDIEDPQMV